MKVISIQLIILLGLLLVTDRVISFLLQGGSGSRHESIETQPQYIPPSPKNAIESYAPGVETRLELEKLFYIDPRLGRSLVPNSQPRHQLIDHGQFIFDVTYHHDVLGRRITPYTQGSNRGKFIALLGCSYTYGLGDPDTGTIAYYLGQLLPDYLPINYGVPGAAAHYFLNMMSVRNLRKEILQNTGIGLYLYIDDHLGRIIGDSQWWNPVNGYPYYELNSNGQLEHHGTFLTGRYWLTKFYELFNESGLKKEFNLHLPIWVTHQHILLACSVIEHLSKQYLDQFQNGSFYVGFLPDSRRDYDALSSCLKERGVKTLDLRNAYRGFTGEVNIPYEGHPNANANRLVARSIVESLDLK